MHSIELKLVFESLAELGEFVRNAPALALAGTPAPVAALSVAHEAAPATQITHAPQPQQHVAHNAAPAPVQHHAQHAAHAPVQQAPVQQLTVAAAPGVDLAVLKAALAGKIRDANADPATRGAKLQAVHGLFGRYGIQGKPLDTLAPHQFDAFHFELQNL